VQSDVTFALAALVGAASMELLHWRHLSRRLASARTKVLLTSLTFWLVTAGMIALSTLGTYFYYWPDHTSPRAALITGAAWPLLLKAIATPNRTELGPRTILDDYLGN
jgi:hypothetical protein